MERYAELDAVLFQYFFEAENRDFPPFLGPEWDSTPVNATPYLVAISKLQRGEVLKKRHSLINFFLEAITDMNALGVSARAAILGGSSIGPKKAPRDLDCVIFYVTETAPDAERVLRWQRDFKEKGLDVRLIPWDGDPILTLKAAMFFSTLYCKNAGSLEIVRGTILVDCTK